MVSSLSPVFDKNAHHWDVAKAIDEGADLHGVYLDRTPLEVLADSVYTCEDLFQKTKLFLDLGVPLSRIKKGQQWSPLDEMNHHPMSRNYPISFKHHRASPFIDMLLERGAKLHQKPRIPAIALALLDKGYVFENTSGWFESWGASGSRGSKEDFEKLNVYGITPQETVEGEDRFVSLLKATKDYHFLLHFVQLGVCQWEINDLATASQRKPPEESSYVYTEWNKALASCQQKELHQNTPQVTARRLSRL